MRRAYRALERVMIGTVAVIAVLVAVLALRLMAGPVDLEFLKPYIARDFDTPGGKMRVDAERISAEWGGLSQPMRLVFSGLHVTDSDKHEVATAPRVALSFEPRSVLRGFFLPRAIVIDRPTLNAEIDREGGMLRRIFAERDPTSQSGVVDLLVEQLLAEPNHRSLLGQLDTVQVERARLTVRDVPSGVTWVAPAARASLKRDAAGVIIAADAQFSSGGEPFDVALSGTYARDRSRISAEAKIDGLKPSMLADLSPDAAVLRGIDIALSGRLEIEADGAGSVHTVSIDITGGSGTLNLPGVLQVAHKVQSVGAHARVEAATHTVRISNVDIDLGAAKVSIVGEGMKTERGQVFTGRAEIRQIPVDRLADYWPIEFAQGGRQWAIANLSGGSLDIAVEFGLSAPGNDISRISVTRSVALLDYRGMKVHYMAHMPELEAVTGRARYEDGHLHFDIASGGAVGLRVTGATVDMTGLNGPPPHNAALHVPIAGLASTAIAFLARPKLALPKDALYDPKRVGGEVAIDLNLAFPLLNSLTVADIDVRADAVLSGFSLKGAIGDVDFTDAAGRVSYADSQLHVAGQGKFDGAPAEVDWREMFAAKAPYRQRYELKGTLPASIMAKAGFPSPEPYISGPVGVALTYQTQANGTGELAAKLDLKGAKASATPLGWTKSAGTEGNLSVALKLAAGGKLAAVDFDGRSNGLAAKGQVKFAGDNAVQQVSLQQLVTGRTDFAFDWKRGNTGVEITVKGRALEWALVRRALRTRDELARANPRGAAETAREHTSLAIQLDQLLVQRGTLGSVNGKVELSGDRIASADVTVSGGKGSAFRVTPAKSGQSRTIGVYVPDFGLLLQNAGWLDGFVGSFLDFSGSFDDSKADSPLDGALRLGPYRLQKVTPRGDVGTLNSTIDGLNRAGNADQQFNGLDAKVTKLGDRIDIKNARTSGPSIGLTAAGWLDTDREIARLRGVVVPAFALNNLLSNVPLLGPLLTGGKDGGVFAISYKLDGSFDDLKLDINMMSAVTPGALRDIFNGSTEGTTPPTTLQPQDKAP